MDEKTVTVGGQEIAFLQSPVTSGSDTVLAPNEPYLRVSVADPLDLDTRTRSSGG